MLIVDDACGRYVLKAKPEDIARHYNLAQKPPALKPNYNAAPGQIMPVITAGAGGSKLEMMKWGLIPSWTKDPRIGYKLINARDDTVFDKPVWRSVILRKRALIPANGFYEWQKPPEGAKKQAKKPFYIHPRQADLFSFAGVWESWRDAEGLEWKTYSILTTEPNAEMSSVHNRMPVILHAEEEAPWLDPANDSRDDIEPFLRPYEDRGLKMHPVSTDVNITRNNDQRLILPVNSA